MDDSAAIFLWKLARAVGRIDFWNLYAELSPFELAVFEALFAIDPWGESRDDLRMALSTCVSAEVKPGKESKLINALTQYVPAAKPTGPEKVTPEQAAAAGRQAFTQFGMR